MFILVNALGTYQADISAITVTYSPGPDVELLRHVAVINSAGTFTGDLAPVDTINFQAGPAIAGPVVSLGVITSDGTYMCPFPTAEAVPTAGPAVVVPSPKLVIVDTNNTYVADAVNTIPSLIAGPAIPTPSSVLGLVNSTGTYKAPLEGLAPVLTEGPAVPVKIPTLVAITSDGLFTADVTAPVVTFTIPATSAVNTGIPIVFFADSSATGYAITTTNDAPTAWSTNPPRTVDASNIGDNTFYAWARDAEGNISFPVIAICEVPFTFYGSIPQGYTTADIYTTQADLLNKTENALAGQILYIGDVPYGKIVANTLLSTEDVAALYLEHYDSNGDIDYAHPSSDLLSPEPLMRINVATDMQLADYAVWSPLTCQQYFNYMVDNTLYTNDPRFLTANPATLDGFPLMVNTALGASSIGTIVDNQVYDSNYQPKITPDVSANQLTLTKVTYTPVNANTVKPSAITGVAISQDSFKMTLPQITQQNQLINTLKTPVGDQNVTNTLSILKIAASTGQGSTQQTTITVQGGLKTTVTYELYSAMYLQDLLSKALRIKTATAADTALQSQLTALALRGSILTVTLTADKAYVQTLVEYATRYDALQAAVPNATPTIPTVDASYLAYLTALAARTDAFGGNLTVTLNTTEQNALNAAAQNAARIQTTGPIIDSSTTTVLTRAIGGSVSANSTGTSGSTSIMGLVTAAVNSLGTGTDSSLVGLGYNSPLYMSYVLAKQNGSLTLGGPAGPTSGTTGTVSSELYTAITHIGPLPPITITVDPKIIIDGFPLQTYSGLPTIKEGVDGLKGERLIVNEVYIGIISSNTLNSISVPSAVTAINVAGIWRLETTKNIGRVPLCIGSQISVSDYAWYPRVEVNGFEYETVYPFSMLDYPYHTLDGQDAVIPIQAVFPDGDLLFAYREPAQIQNQSTRVLLRHDFPMWVEHLKVSAASMEVEFEGNAEEDTDKPYRAYYANWAYSTNKEIERWAWLMGEYVEIFKPAVEFQGPSSAYTDMQNAYTIRNIPRMLESARSPGNMSASYVLDKIFIAGNKTTPKYKGKLDPFKFYPLNSIVTKGTDLLIRVFDYNEIYRGAFDAGWSYMPGDVALMPDGTYQQYNGNAFDIYMVSELNWVVLNQRGNYSGLTTYNKYDVVNDIATGEVYVTMTVQVGASPGVTPAWYKLKLIANAQTGLLASASLLETAASPIKISVTGSVLEYTEQGGPQLLAEATLIEHAQPDNGAIEIDSFSRAVLVTGTQVEYITAPFLVITTLIEATSPVVTAELGVQQLTSTVKTGTTIQFKRGNKANLPASAGVGEPLVTLDTAELFVGTGSGLRKISDVIVSETEPAVADRSKLWFNPAENVTRVYKDGTWQISASQAAVDYGSF